MWVCIHELAFVREEGKISHETTAALGDRSAFGPIWSRSSEK